jgi:hypothetical protein
VLVLALALVHFILVDGVGTILVSTTGCPLRYLVTDELISGQTTTQSVIPPLGRAYSSLLGAVTTRATLLAMGYWWIPSPEVVTLRKG